MFTDFVQTLFFNDASMWPSCKRITCEKTFSVAVATISMPALITHVVIQYITHRITHSCTLPCTPVPSPNKEGAKGGVKQLVRISSLQWFIGHLLSQNQPEQSVISHGFPLIHRWNFSHECFWDKSLSRRESPRLKPQPKSYNFCSLAVLGSFF